MLAQRVGFSVSLSPRFFSEKFLFRQKKFGEKTFPKTRFRFVTRTSVFCSFSSDDEDMEGGDMYNNDQDQSDKERFARWVVLEAVHHIHTHSRR